ncbi:hypothetical protein E4J93_01200 [Collinsella sp. BA40]|nr:hypothetical protein E4J93_01200 [Collinsella sp. BA40]
MAAIVDFESSRGPAGAVHERCETVAALGTVEKPGSTAAGPIIRSIFVVICFLFLRLSFIHSGFHSAKRLKTCI